MKLKLNLIMMAAILFLAACSSDDDPVLNHATDVAGTYKGYTVAEFQYTEIPITTPGENVSLTANENGTCNISFESDAWGKFTISGATVTLSGSNYTVKGSGKTVMAMTGGKEGEYDCTIEGTISKDKQTVSFLFNAPVPMGGIKVAFTLGDAPANMIIAKAYEGSLAVSVMGANQGVFENKVTIKSQKNGKAEMLLGKFGEGAMAFQDMTITDVEVSAKSDGSYTVAGTIDTTSGTTKVVGSLEGSIKEGKANITFTMRPGAMPMDIIAVFTSKE